MPEVPSERNSTGNAVGVHESPVSLPRCSILSLASPGRDRPDKSPLMSAIAAGSRGGCGRLLVARRLNVAPVRDELVWIDCEMTGLDLKTDLLIEIAVLVTDADLNILGDGIDVVIHADDAPLSSMIPVVTDMH